MSSQPFIDCISLHVDKDQAATLVRLLSKKDLVPVEWRELIGLKECLEEQLQDTSKAVGPSVNSRLFNDRSRY